MFIPFLGLNIPRAIIMAKVHVCNVLVLDNPAQFMTKLEFEITFECIEDLPEDLEWKIIYVGSAESEEFDQILDTVYVSNKNNI
jgi:histone chaperone ASF1